MPAVEQLVPKRLAPASVSALQRVLVDARAAGLLGNAPLADHVANGEDFAAALTALGAGRVTDLGSGAGVPALVIALALPTVQLAMVERGAKRAAFLRDAVSSLEAFVSPGRVQVVESSAEDAARSDTWSGWADAVTARSFGPPSVVAECASRLVRPGGWVVISEPPTPATHAGDRWPAAPLRMLGLAPVKRVRGGHTTLQVLERVGDPEAGYPRRDAVTRKRLLF